ncbi:MAG: ABC transporter permease [Bacteroidales bacterium]
MLWYLLEKEFKQFFRNIFLPRVVVILPFAVLLFFPMVANFEVKNIKLSVVDLDRSTLSSNLVKSIDASPYFSIVEYAPSSRRALESIESNRVDMIFEIPPKFEKGLVNGEGAKVQIMANAIDGIKGGLGSSYLTTIVTQYSSSIAPHLSPIGVNLPPTLSALYRYNPFLVYKVYMIPAFIVMMLSILCGFLPTLNIVLEKENGTIEQLNVTPIKRSYFILSKLIPYWLMGFVIITIGILVSWLFYNYLPSGSLLTIYLFTAVFVLAISGFGLVISNYAGTVQQAIFIIFFFVITFIFMSGLYTPIDSMPDWARVLSRFSPLTYMISAFRSIFLKGSGTKELLEPLFTLLAFAILLNGWAIISYRKSRV